jgi:hypothetical protein
LKPDGTEVRSVDTRFPQQDRQAPIDIAHHLLESASPALRALFHGSGSSS